MNIIKEIIDDYESLIHTKIKILLNNGDVINFTFQKEDLPHLLGLQHLIDIPILSKYNRKQLNANDLYNQMCNNEEIANSFENSIYFEELYETRMKYFTKKIILNIIQSKQIIKFNPKKIKNFSTKLDKVEYMFWKRYKDKNDSYGHLGIGFMSTGHENDVNYPNTFFFRMDNDYIREQEFVLPLSFMKKDKYGNKTFKIYWDVIWKSLDKNNHYKKLKSYRTENGEIDIKKLNKCNDVKILKHYELLQLDILDKIYLPYMNSNFKWTNNEKQFILEKMKGYKYDLLPSDVKQLLSEYRYEESENK